MGGEGWLFLALMCGVGLIIWLCLMLIRLRLELWVNRRVIAALEQSGVQPEKKSKFTGVVFVYGSLFLLILWMILSDLLQK